MLDIMRELKEEYGMIAIKAEFEAEGSRLDELVMLNEVVFRANSKLIIKIGGCEAMRDLDQCRLLGAEGVMAPMIETPFAMKKFKEAGTKTYKDEVKDIEWVINAETITCYDNYPEILKAGQGFLNTVVVGRSDLSASMGVDRNDIDGETLFEKVASFAEMSRKAGLVASFGGGVSVDTIPFMLNLGNKIDQFETRKVVLPRPNTEKKAHDMIMKALEFEMLYLKNKCLFYNRMATEDAGRLKALEERLNENGMKVR